MLTFLSAKFGPRGAVRRYQHPQLGVLRVLTMYGADGSADIVMLNVAIAAAQVSMRMRAGQDLLTASREFDRILARATPKRKPRRRTSRGSAPKPAA